MRLIRINLFACLLISFFSNSTLAHPGKRVVIALKPLFRPFFLVAPRFPVRSFFTSPAFSSAPRTPPKFRRTATIATLGLVSAFAAGYAVHSATHPEKPDPVVGLTFNDKLKRAFYELQNGSWVENSEDGYREKTVKVDPWLGALTVEAFNTLAENSKDEPFYSKCNLIVDDGQLHFQVFNDDDEETPVAAGFYKSLLEATTTALQDGIDDWQRKTATTDIPAEKRVAMTNTRHHVASEQPLFLPALYEKCSKRCGVSYDQVKIKTGSRFEIDGKIENVHSFLNCTQTEVSPSPYGIGFLAHHRL